MGKKTTSEILEFGIEYARKCDELEDKLDIDLWLWDTELRFGKYGITLDTLIDCEDSKEAMGCAYEADCDLDTLLGYKHYDGAILCEGYVYEALYYFSGYGDTSTYGREATKELYDELTKVLEKHGFHLDMSRGGTIQLQCTESFDEEDEDDEE